VLDGIEPPPVDPTAEDVLGLDDPDSDAVLFHREDDDGGEPPAPVVSELPVGVRTTEGDAVPVHDSTDDSQRRVRCGSESGSI